MPDAQRHAITVGLLGGDHVAYGLKGFVPGIAGSGNFDNGLAERAAHVSHVHFRRTPEVLVAEPAFNRYGLGHGLPLMIQGCTSGNGAVIRESPGPARRLDSTCPAAAVKHTLRTVRTADPRLL